MIMTQLREVQFLCPSQPSCATWNVEGWFDDDGKFRPVDGHDAECVDCDRTGEPIDDLEVA